ncbi:MAG: hypothetical protein QM702_20965 [Rubrivivax sp.]
MIPSPLRTLVGQALRPFQKPRGVLDTVEIAIALWDQAGPIGAEAIGGSGVGLDLFAGERVLASCFMRDTPKEWADHRLSCAITDRRTSLSGWSSITGMGTLNDKRFSVLHTDVQRVEVKSGMLSNHVSLFTAQGKHDLTFPKIEGTLGAFYNMLVRMPYEQRREPPTPFDEPPPAHALWAHDPPAYAMLEGAARHGGETAKDFTARVLLAHRARVTGPGMNDGWWISPMAARDLGHTLARIFGQAVAHAQPSPGVEHLDFRIDPRRDPLDAAVTALGVASYLALGVGYSLGGAIAKSLREKAPVTFLRVAFSDRKAHSGYQLYTNIATLERADALMAHKLHQILAAASYDVLARRIERGWDVPYHALFS